MPDVNLAYQTVFKLVGKQGQRVLEKKEFLDSVAKVDKDLAKTIEKSVEGVTNPTFELSGKATANYNIAGLKIRNGNNEVIGTGAVSKAQPDLRDASVIKGRLDLPNGEIIRIDGNPSKTLNVYNGEDRVKRVCSATDGSYEDTVRTFGKNGIYKEIRVFDAKENKMKTIYKCDDIVISDMKITEGKKGVTKLEMKETPTSHPLVEFYDTNGNMVAGSRFFNGGEYQVEKICDKGTDKVTKTPYRASNGDVSRTEYEYITENNEKLHIRTNFNNGHDKECISSIYVENPDGNKYTPLFSKHYPKEIQELLNKENVTGVMDEVDKMNEIIMKYYDKCTTNLMK